MAKKAKATTSQPTDAKAAYVPTPKEQCVLDAHLERRNKAKPLPRQKIAMKSGVPNLSDGHADPVVGASLTMEALGMSRVGELTALLQDVVNLTQNSGKPDEYRINEMLAQIAAVEPRDSVEAMLATQMTAIHNATLKAARQLRGCETIPQQDSNANALNKLARTFTSQVDALKRYRSKGEQKMTVEHVTVNEGGQAIVGNVEGGGGRNEK